MQWWCSAQGIAWSWTWRPYLGTWILVLALAWLYRRAYRATGRTGAGGGGGGGGRDGDSRRGRAAAAAAGILALWIALDWPVGTLGAGYLASVHMVQFLLVAMIAPPLLLYGLPPAALAPLEHRRTLRTLVRAGTHPVVGLIAFDVIVVVTHVPRVVDALMGSQLGSFALDMAWLLSGLAFWWPLVATPPGRAPLPIPLKIGYLFLGTLAHTGVATYLLLAPFPVYRTYELAPPIRGTSALGDQQVAGGLMLVVGTAIVLGVISMLFFRWQQTSEREPPFPAGEETSDALR